MKGFLDFFVNNRVEIYYFIFSYFEFFYFLLVLVFDESLRLQVNCRIKFFLSIFLRNCNVYYVIFDFL